MSSKIAEALAKAKERTGTTTAPFFTANPAGAPVLPVDPAKAKALRKARNTQRFWIALLSVAAVLTLLVIWNRLKPEAPLAAAPPPPPVAKPVSAGPLPAGLPSNTATPVVTPPAVAVASTVSPRVDLYDIVNALVITAVLPGERPRLMYKGRIVAVGEIVEGELVFAGVEDGRIVLNDRRGAVYTRRY